MRLVQALALSMIVLAGCGGSTLPPVEVVGNQADLQSLAGSWHGTFHNAQLRRTGQIDFQMSATSDSAFGEVNMYMETPSQPIWTNPTSRPANSASTPTPWQRIRFVRVENGYVSGEMQPMYEPRCECYTVAQFIGRLRGDAIEGSYTSRSQTGRFETSGSWKVERVAAAAQH
jgi:hypothetical protein